MSYLFVEMIWYLLAALVLGLLLGWMIWGWRTRRVESDVVDPGAARLTADLEAGRSELARLRSELASRDASLSDAKAQEAALLADLDIARKAQAGATGGEAETRGTAAQVTTLKARVAELEGAIAELQSREGAPVASVAATPSVPASIASDIAVAAPSGASLAGELGRAQTRAAQAEAGLRDLRRDAGAAEKAAAEHKSLQARVDQLEDDLADARRLADLSGNEAPADTALKLELDELKEELGRHATARQTLVADLEDAKTRASAAERELAELRAAAAESDAEVGAASPQPLLTPSNTDADDGDPDDAPTQASGEVDPDAVGDRPALLEAPREGGADDLKKIKGVGPKLEEILHDLGVYHFDQVASWTEREVSWVDARLRFRGRVNRDGWIEQATKLAAGEETEFSKKVDKGGVYD